MTPEACRPYHSLKVIRRHLCRPCVCRLLILLSRLTLLSPRISDTVGRTAAITISRVLVWGAPALGTVVISRMRSVYRGTLWKIQVPERSAIGSWRGILSKPRRHSICLLLPGSNSWCTIGLGTCRMFLILKIESPFHSDRTTPGSKANSPQWKSNPRSRIQHGLGDARLGRQHFYATEHFGGMVRKSTGMTRTRNYNCAHKWTARFGWIARTPSGFLSILVSRAST